MFYELTKDDFTGLVAGIQSKGRSRQRFDFGSALALSGLVGLLF